MPLILLLLILIYVLFLQHKEVYLLGDKLDEVDIMTIWRKRLTNSINYEAVCRIAPVTPGFFKLSFGFKVRKGIPGFLHLFGEHIRILVGLTDEGRFGDFSQCTLFPPLL